MGGYSLLLAARRGPVPTAPPAPPLELPAEVPEPERLPRRPAVQPASLRPGSDGRVLVPVELKVAGGRRDDPGGVAILDGGRGAPLAWRPLAEGTETPEGLRLVFEQVPAGDHLVALSASPERARYGYRTRAPLRVAPGEDPQPPVLDARAQDVTVRTVLPGRPEGSVPPVFRLSRADDPHWHPPISAADAQERPMTVPTPDGVLHLRGLGPGRYLLQPADGAYQAFELSVPGPESVTATFAR